eukprot:GHVU01137850.1.p1 GENE.GHVU01137850.1~~GHVU01137850.1.p1  ORF type:complete len:100 (-),score=1.94 GHVU01137850.1:575-874(-)
MDGRWRGGMRGHSLRHRPQRHHHRRTISIGVVRSVPCEKVAPAVPPDSSAALAGDRRCHRKLRLDWLHDCSQRHRNGLTTSGQQKRLGTVDPVAASFAS